MFGKKIKVSELGLNEAERFSIHSALEILKIVKFGIAEKLLQEYDSGTVPQKDFRKIVEYVQISIEEMSGTDAEKAFGGFLASAYEKIRRLG